MSFLSFLASPVQLNDAGDAIAPVMRGGHPDEGTALLADADYQPTPDPSPEEWREVSELIADQTLSTADDYIREELGRVRAAAREAVGNVRCRVDRSVILDGTGEFRVQWMVSIADAATGIGADGDEALADALRCIDAAKGIVSVPSGGYRINGVASILASPFRSEADALLHARRVAVNVQYLDAALVWQCAGIADLRQPSPSSAAVA
jgi:hypothetical protein